MIWRDYGNPAYCLAQVNESGRGEANQYYGAPITLYEWVPANNTESVTPPVEGGETGWRVTNYPIPEGSYQLPETGGPGAHWYILGGILLITGGTLWYRKQEDGKEGTRTS